MLGASANVLNVVVSRRNEPGTFLWQTSLTFPPFERHLLANETCRLLSGVI